MWSNEPVAGAVSGAQAAKAPPVLAEGYRKNTPIAVIFYVSLMQDGRL